MGAVLAIRLRALGDVVLTTPALRALKRGHPGDALEVVTEPRYAPLLEGAEGVDRVWPVERTARASLELARRLRRRRYDLAVDFFGNPRSAFLARASGATTRAGYALRGRARAYHVRVARTLPPAPGRREYAAATHLRLAEAVGGIGDGLDVRLPLGPRAGSEADAVLERAGIGSPGRCVGLVAAGTWPTKTWPVSHAAALARSLMAAGRPVLLIAGPGEERVSRAVVSLAPGVRVLPSCGVSTLVAVLARLGAVVGTDSGPRHVAAAFGVPTVAWFGPTHPDTWTPPGPRHASWWTSLPCRGCDRTSCPHWNCMPGLAPADAAELVRSHLERHAGTAADLGPAARA